MTRLLPIRLLPIRLLPTLLLLASCATPTGTPTGTPDEQACASAANDDPTVKALIIKGTGNPAFQNNSQDELRAAKQQARLTCLRGRGAIPQGGVERQKPL